MPWFLVDDDFPDDERVIAVSLAARGLWATAGAWASRHHTDVVPQHVLASFGSTSELESELTRVRIWKRVRSGAVRFTQEGLCRIPTQEQVENGRKNKAARQARWRQKRRPVDAGVDAVDNPERKQAGQSRRPATRSRRPVDASTDASRLDPDPSISVVDLVSSVADRKARDLADDDLVQTIKTTIRTRTGAVIDDAWALKIARQLLNGHQPRNRAAYCKSAIERERDPRTRFLPNGGRP